jgi:hypothetical protein
MLHLIDFVECMAVNLRSWSSNHDSTTSELGSVPIEEAISYEIKVVSAAHYHPSVVHATEVPLVDRQVTLDKKKSNP